MSLPTFMSWLCTGAMFALLACSLQLPFRRQYPPLLRFGPLTVVGAYLLVALALFLDKGVAFILLIPNGCFGLFLGARMLSHRSALSYTFTVSTAIFWPVALFVFWPTAVSVFSRYIAPAYFHR